MAKLDPSPLSTAEGAAAAKAPQAAAAAAPWVGSTPAAAAAPAAPQPLAKPVAATAPATAASPQPGTSDATAAVGAEGSDPEGEAVQKIAEAEEALQAAQANLAGALSEKAEVGRKVAHATEEVDRLIVALESLAPKATVTNTIQAYHESQKRLLQERAEKLQALKKSGVDFKALLTVKAPIDAAFARKQGRGGARPK
jgi:hypothetical protein